VQNIFKCISILLRLEVSRDNGKEVLRCIGIKIWAKIYRNNGADRTLGRLPFQVFFVDCPCKCSKQILVDGYTIFCCRLFDLGNRDIAVQDSKMIKRQLFTF